MYGWRIYRFVVWFIFLFKGLIGGVAFGVVLCWSVGVCYVWCAWFAFAVLCVVAFW